MPSIDALVADVERARRDYLAPLRTLSPAQGEWRPTPETWSAADNTEHLLRAEQAGVSMIWSAADGLRRGRPVWQGETVHRGKSIEDIVAATWAARETAPESARPQWGGPLDYWVAALDAQSPLLARLTDKLAGLDLEQVVHPHPISGPLDAIQRLQFLRFHLDRHREQVAKLLAHPEFPRA